MCLIDEYQLDCSGLAPIMRDLCSKFEVNQPDAPEGKGVIYVKSRWFQTKFSLWVTDGLNAWFGDGREEEVSERAFSWDCTVAEFMEAAEKYLGVQDPTSKYSFISDKNDTRKFSWTLERGGVPLVVFQTVQKALNPKEITCDVLDFLMSGSSSLSEKLMRKTRSFEQMKAEAEKCLAQSTKFKDEKLQFEDDIYKKFVAVLNSKKDKIRELNEQVLRLDVNRGKNVDEAEAESEDEFDETDKEDNEEEDNDSKDETLEAGTEKDADQDSGATEILPADSPMDDISSKDPGVSKSTLHDLVKAEGDLKVPAGQTSVFHDSTDAITDASLFFSGSTYTSAPRKRRHQ